MVPASTMSASLPDHIRFDCAWNDLYPTLHSMVTRLVYAYRVPAWYGQEEDIAADIIQETARRLLERVRKAERGEATPIQCFERMAVVTAFNYCRDLRRHDRRFTRCLLLDPCLEGSEVADEIDLSEIAVEHAYQ